MSENEIIEYYIIEFRLYNNSYYFLWYYGDMDSLFFVENNQIKVFSVTSDLEEYCCRNKLFLSKEFPAVYDFNFIRQWLVGEKEDVHCSVFLNAWNIILDIAHQEKESFIGDDDETIDVYRKLFCGCNLPAVKTNDKIYIPNWSIEEINLLSQVLEDGLRIVNNCVKTNSRMDKEEKTPLP